MRPRLHGLLRLFRVELPLTAGVCVVLGELLAGDGLPGAGATALGFLSVFFLSAAALILNDYFDLESDRVNAPHRPLPAGLVTPRDVVVLFAVVSLLGFVASALIGPGALLVGILVWVVGLLYNWRLKRAGLLGNLMVACSVGMTFIFGGIAVGRPFEPIVWFFALLVLLIDLGEEIAADALDLEGDRLAGSHSLAVVLGHDRALRASAAIFFLVVATSSVPFAFGLLAWHYLPPLVLLDAVIIVATLKLLDPHQPRRLRYIRLIYLSGLATLLVCIAINMLA